MPLRVDKTRQIEESLARVYLVLFKEIKKDVNFPSSLQILRNKYNRKVYDSTRQAISQVVGESHSYVSRRLGVEAYISDSDVILIKSETDRAVSMFWTRLGADATRELQIQQQQNKIIATEERTKQSFDTAFYLTNTAMIATTGTLALSTKSKVEQIASDPELKDNEKLEEKPKIRWVTANDERVCQTLPDGRPGCAVLDGQEWDYDDPEIPVPGRLGPNGTHPNCRCYLSLE